MDRLEELMAIVSTLDEDRAAVVRPLLGDIVFMERRLSDLKKLPFLHIHPERPELQKPTPAARQYRETMQAYTTALKVILTALYKIENSAADELMSKLEEFDLDTP